MTNAFLDSIGSRRARSRRAPNVSRRRRGTLVSARIDGFLVGWLGVLLWVAQQTTRGNFFIAGSGLLVGAVTIAQAAHFAMSYRLAYRNPRAAVRRHPVALLAAPLLLAAGLGTIALLSLRAGTPQVRNVTSLLTLTVFVLSGFHFVRQSYGISRLGVGSAGLKLAPGESKALNLAVFPLWAASLQPIPAVGTLVGRLGQALHSPSFSGSLFFAIRICAVAAVAAIAVVFLHAWKRTAIRPTSMMIAPFAAVTIWMLSPGNHITASLAFTATHSAQYLACTYRAERNHHQTPFGWRGIRSSVYVLLVAAAVGTLLTRVLPQLADQTFSVSGAPEMFAGLAFVFLNLNHYVTDAVIWRSKGDLVQSLK
jgi:hypothetical protein